MTDTPRTSGVYASARAGAKRATASVSGIVHLGMRSLLGRAGMDAGFWLLPSVRTDSRPAYTSGSPIGSVEHDRSRRCTLRRTISSAAPDLGRPDAARRGASAHLAM